MYGILLWSLLMARNVSHPLRVITKVSLTPIAGQYPHEWHPIRRAAKFQAHIHVHGGRDGLVSF